MGRVAAISAADSAMATARAHSGWSWAGRVAMGSLAGAGGGGWVRRMLGRPLRARVGPASSAAPLTARSRRPPPSLVGGDDLPEPLGLVGGQAGCPEDLGPAVDELAGVGVAMAVGDAGGHGQVDGHLP